MNEEEVLNRWINNGYFILQIEVNGIKRRIREHRLIWEKARGKIPKGFVIHHKNGDRLDNRLENLDCVKWGEHNKNHVLKRKVLGRKLECLKCNKMKNKKDFYKQSSTTIKASSWCKDCCKKYKQYNRDKLKKYGAKYYQENKERSRNLLRKWRKRQKNAKRD